MKFLLVIFISILLASGSAFATTETLENSNVKFTFDYTSTSFGLSSITNSQTGKTFTLLNNNQLWEMDLRLPSGNVATVNPSTSGAAVDVVKTGNQITATWPVVNSGTDQYTVVVVVQLLNNSTSWDILITPISSSRAIHKVRFPQLWVDPISNPTLVLPLYSGLLTHSPLSISETFLRSPGIGFNIATSNIFSYYDSVSKDQLYMMVKDKDAYLKDYYVGPDNSRLRFRFLEYPSNNITVGNSYDMPFPIEIGVMKGDWYDAAQLYRSWALPLFATRGKLKSKVPSSLQNAAFFYVGTYCDSYAVPGSTCSNVNPPSSVVQNLADPIKQWKDFLGVKSSATAIAYWWLFNSFGENFPFVTLSDPTGVAQAFTEARSYGASVGPYWRVTTSKSDSSEYTSYNLSQYSKMDDSGNTIFAPGEPTTAEMSPYHPGWQDLHIDNLKSWSSTLGGFSNIYEDVVSSNSVNDYNPNLPTAGDGRHDVQGAKNIALRSRQSFSNLIQSTEYMNQEFVDSFDYSYWTNVGNLPVQYDDDKWFMIPLYQTIFHEYQATTPPITVGPINNLSLERLAYYTWAGNHHYGSVATLYGSGEGPFVPDNPANIHPNSDVFFDYAKTLMLAEYNFKDFFRFGQMLRPLSIQSGTLAKSSIFAVTSSFAKMHTGDSSNVNKVLGSVFKSENGDLMISLINWFDTAESYSYTFKFSDYGLTSGKKYYFSEISNTTPILKNIYTTDFTISESLAGRTPKLILLSATPPASFCGNNIKEGSESCDGTDSSTCPGLCKVDCSCGTSVDSTPPTGSISINSGSSSVSNLNVTLTLNYADNGGVEECSYSNDNITYSTPEICVTSKVWKMSTGNGSKTVYYKITDTSNNSTVVNDSITLSISHVAPSFDGSTTVFTQTNPFNTPVTLEVLGAGKVVYASNVLPTQSTNFDSIASISSNLACVDASDYLYLEFPSRVFIYNLSLTNPIPMVNSSCSLTGMAPCSSSLCSNVLYQNGILSFDVALPGFYSVSENNECGNSICESNETHASCPSDCPILPAPACGDAVCNGNENVTSCPSDCFDEKPIIPVKGVEAQTINSFMFVLVALSLVGMGVAAFSLFLHHRKMI